MPADPQATLDEIKQALANHPRVCNVHAGNDPVSCGWKAAVADVQAILDRETTTNKENNR